MTTQLTPPPAGEARPEQAVQSEGTRTGTRALAITISVLGAGALVRAGVGTAINTVRAATVVESTHTLADVAGIDAIDVDISRGDLQVRFAGDEATLDVRGSAEWRLERDGDELVVSNGSDPLDWDFGWDWSWEEQSATLTLPEELAGADLDVGIEAGRVIADGRFGEVSFDMGAGSIEIEGTAEALDAQIGAGTAILELADVREATLELAAGRLDGTLTGEAPDRLGVDVSAGSMDLTVPDVPYNVTVEREAGDVDTNAIQQSLDAPRAIDVRVAAGMVELRAG